MTAPKKVRLWLALWALGWGLPAPAPASMLIIEGSDQHAAYENIPDFLTAFSSVRQRFLKSDPQGTVVWAINGDYSGHSAWNSDRGQLGMDLVASLSSEAEIVLNPGNHEAFDWGGKAGLDLFLSQARDLARRLSTSRRAFRYTTANLELTPVAKPFFEPYRDLHPRSGGTVRFVGLMLPRFFAVSDYDRKASPQLINGVSPLLGAAQEAIRSAAAVPDLKALVFLLHDDSAETEQWLRSLLAWKTQDPKLRAVRLPVVFAGHDHVHAEKDILGTRLVDSQSHFAFSAVRLRDDGTLGESEFYPLDRQRKMATGHGLSEVENAIVGKTRRRLEQSRALNLEVVGQSPGFTESKLDLKGGRRSVGDSIADAMTDWGRAMVKAGERDAARPRGAPVPARVVAMFNSSSYRREEPIPPGPLRREVITSIYPFEGRPELLLVKGSEVQELFSSLREDRKSHHTYSPQLSSNLREDAQGRLQAASAGGRDRWEPLQTGEWYLLVLDPWLGNNGYRIASWERRLAAVAARGDRIVPSEPESFTDVLLHYWVPRLSSMTRRDVAVKPRK